MGGRKMKMKRLSLRCVIWIEFMAFLLPFLLILVFQNFRLVMEGMVAALCCKMFLGANVCSLLPRRSCYNLAMT